MTWLGLVRRAAAALSLLACSACASIVSDNESTTYFETTPESAKCELRGQDFTRIIETPATTTLPAAAAPITVECGAENHRSMTAELDTSMDGWVVGNVLFGGVIGAVIDASRGAGQKYPPRFSMVLEPESFATLAERDAWYDRRRAQIDADWSEAIATINNSCGRSNAQKSCANRVADAERKRDAELQALEQRRQSATVTSSS